MVDCNKCMFKNVCHVANLEDLKEYCAMFAEGKPPF
jgi:hypothetical protein